MNYLSNELSINYNNFFTVFKNIPKISLKKNKFNKLIGAFNAFTC